MESPSMYSIMTQIFVCFNMKTNYPVLHREFSDIEQ